MKEDTREQHKVSILGSRWLSEKVLEVGFERPEMFTFIPGQKIHISTEGISREYTLVNSPDASELTICVRYFENGRFSSILADSRIGTVFSLSSATGYFTYQTHKRKAVFVATGTGIAPFLAFIRAGITDFLLLHGVRKQCDLLYREEFAKASGVYMPCISVEKNNGMFWNGRVTEYLVESLVPGEYDFYLCGNRDMIREAFRIADRKFPGSRIFAETFY